MTRQGSIDLTNGVSIEIRTSNFRRVRGRTVVCAICDELAFWQGEDSANPDKEVLATLRPSLATVPGSLLICLSTPYARRGQLWKAYKEHYGREEENRLVIKAPTRALNQTISQKLIDEALAEDPATARAEWLGEFRSDIESYVSP